jgi:DNA-binding CsgD family transcriptional regulator
MSTKLINIDMLARLTVKQREALDLLIKHKTSKEISRLIGVSPHTVDQRIEHAKRVLGASSRGELAQTYLELLRISEQLTCQESHIDPTRDSTDALERGQTGVGFMLAHPERTEMHVTEAKPEAHLVGPRLLHGPSAILVRLTAVLAIAVLLVVTLLGGISIYVTASRLLADWF